MLNDAFFNRNTHKTRLQDDRLAKVQPEAPLGAVVPY